MKIHAILATALAAACMLTAATSAQQWDPYAVAPDPYNGSQELYSPVLHEQMDFPIDSLNAGYWVIVGSVPMHDMQAWERGGRSVKARAAACGLVPEDDLSANFRGFVPGYNVFLVGPYDKAQALAVRNAAQRCIPDTYVKFGEFVGGY